MKTMYGNLIESIKKNKWQLVKEYADCDFDLMQNNNQLLRAAIAYEHSTSVIALLLYVEPNYGNPLSLAIKTGNLAIVKILLEKGARVRPEHAGDLALIMLEDDYENIADILNKYNTSGLC